MAFCSPNVSSLPGTNVFNTEFNATENPGTRGIPLSSNVAGLPETNPDKKQFNPIRLTRLSQTCFGSTPQHSTELSSQAQVRLTRRCGRCFPTCSHCLARSVCTGKGNARASARRPSSPGGTQLCHWHCCSKHPPARLRTVRNRLSEKLRQRRTSRRETFLWDGGGRLRNLSTLTGAATALL